MARTTKRVTTHSAATYQTDPDRAAKKSPRNVSQQSSSHAEILDNSVHNLWLRIEKAYSHDEDIKADVAEAALDGINAFLNSLAKSKEVDLRKKLELGETIEGFAQQFQEQITPQVPKKAPKLWNDFKNAYGNNPYLFAHQVYGPTVDFMIMSDFLKLDPALHRSMYKYRDRVGPPAPELDIARKTQKLEAFDSKKIIAWSDVLAAAPTSLRSMLRAYYAQQRRLKRRS